VVRVKRCAPLLCFSSLAPNLDISHVFAKAVITDSTRLAQAFGSVSAFQLDFNAQGLAGSWFKGRKGGQGGGKGGKGSEASCS
jgi:hypothetical protein